MSSNKIIHKRKLEFLPPIEHTGLKLSAPLAKAGGMDAVKASLSHIRKELGMSGGILRLNKMNQKGGFDCPGCAWPDPDGHRSSLGEYCENGAKALAEEATTKQLLPEFFKKNSLEELSTWSDYQLGKSGRLVRPMYLGEKESHYKEVSWQDAFNIIGKELNTLKDPNEAIFYTSGRTSNEAAFMYQLMIRTFGTNNLPDCSNMCHESSGTALGETLGIGKGSVTLEDIYIADLIIVIGQNPGTNHPRMLSALKKNKDNGGKIISINPLPEAGLEKFIDPQSPIELLKGGTQLSDLHVPVKINGDVPLLKGIMKILYNAEMTDPGSVFDLEFIKNNTKGFEEFIDSIKDVDLNEMAEQSGIGVQKMSRIASLIIARKNMIICWAMGLTQHENGVNNIREVVNLLLLRGSIGKAGAGTCPVRGHSNVQGDRTVGIVEKPKEAFLQALDSEFEINSPRNHGYDVVAAIEAMHQGKAKIFVGMGGNFISATPDSTYTAEAVQNCQLTVQISTKLNRAHIVTGETALILPCLGRSEKDIQRNGRQFVTVENSMGVVHKSEGKFPPVSGFLKSEPAIVGEMARAIFGESNPIKWEEMVADYATIRDHMSRVLPGFENYNERVENPSGFYLPNGAREGKFNNKEQKALFTINEVPEWKLRFGEYLMMTIRSHDQYNTTIYGLNDRYRGIENERRVVLMNKDDMKDAGFETKDLVDITSHFRDEKRYAKSWIVIPYPIPRGCVATYFPEANVLVPLKQKARRSHTPASKSVVVTILKS